MYLEISQATIVYTDPRYSLCRNKIALSEVSWAHTYADKARFDSVRVLAQFRVVHYAR